jgi:hypothetical protein
MEKPTVDHLVKKCPIFYVTRWLTDFKDPPVGRTLRKTSPANILTCRSIISGLLLAILYLHISTP